MGAIKSTLKMLIRGRTNIKGTASVYSYLKKHKRVEARNSKDFFKKYCKKEHYAIYNCSNIINQCDYYTLSKEESITGEPLVWYGDFRRELTKERLAEMKESGFLQ